MNGFSSGDGGRGDDGSRITGGGNEECDFDDYALTASWETLISGSGGSDYLQACADAWQAARDAGLVDANNEPTDWAYASNPDIRVPGAELWDPATVDALTADGSNISDWVKISSRQFNTSEGPAEMHVYRNMKTGELFLDRGWKLVFKAPF